jgi:O-acetyl-ADP-ribose deacetylase (regulator of RNase III)
VASQVIESIQGDILKSNCSCLINTVNCVGVMGKGLALQFKREYPAMFAAYQKECDLGLVQPGRLSSFPIGNGKHIILFPTKKHWRHLSRIEWIKDGLSVLPSTVLSLGCHSVAIPPLGCGNGGLNWDDVVPLIFQAFEKYPNIKVHLHEPKEVFDLMEREYDSWLNKRFCEFGY